MKLSRAASSSQSSHTPRRITSSYAREALVESRMHTLQGREGIKAGIYLDTRETELKKKNEGPLKTSRND